MERRVPFQVMLEPEQHHQLSSAAERRGQSIGSLIRESVAAYLAHVSVDDDPLLGLIGLAEDTGPRPHGDVATEHDAYLADIVVPSSADEEGASKPRPAKRQPTKRQTRRA